MARIELYADILFLINFAMDFLSLYLAGRAMHKPIRKPRILLSAALGALCGTVETCLGGFRAFFRFLTGAVLSAGMTCAAFGKPSGIRRLFRESVTVWGTGALIGGIMTFLMSLGDPVVTQSGERFPLALTLCFLLSLAVSRIHRTPKARTARVCVSANGIQAEFTGLVDSGCMVREPISSCPVILVKRRAAEEFARLLEEESPSLRVRVIPVRGIGGERLLYGFLPDSVTVADEAVEAVVAIDGEGGDYGGADALIPAELIR